MVSSSQYEYMAYMYVHIWKYCSLVTDPYYIRAPFTSSTSTGIECACQKTNRLSVSIKH